MDAVYPRNLETFARCFTLQGILFDVAGDPAHFAQADSAAHADDACEEHRALNRPGVLAPKMRQTLGKARRAINRSEDFGERHEVSLGEIPRQGLGIDVVLLGRFEREVAGRHAFDVRVGAGLDIAVRL